jgi:Domain of unknown function (DUF4185)
MSTRREFLTQTAVAFFASASPISAVQAAKAKSSDEETRLATKGGAAEILRIKSAVRRDETILRRHDGDTGVGGFTWLSDDRQLASIGDGHGWPRTPEDHYYWSQRIVAATGGPQSATFETVSTYPEIPLWDLFHGAPPYYGGGMLAVDGRIYQYLTTCSRPFTAEQLEKSGDVAGWHMNGSKLIYSPDNGRTWCNQDGSAPVVRESYKELSRKSLVFFEEPQAAFSHLSILQMGKDYGDNQDGYVYVFSPNGFADGTMNELVMFRVPKAQILDRNSYEYFAALRGDGGADWTKDINARGLVHTFPSGGIPKSFPGSWIPSVVYNAPLGFYMMTASKGVGSDAKGSGPSSLGIWIALRPWGPWRQILEEPSWTPGGDAKASCAGPEIVPKWISADGRSFWLSWVDVQQSTNEDVYKAMYRDRTEAEFNQARRKWGEFHPYAGLNIQRVDLVPA